MSRDRLVCASAIARRLGKDPRTIRRWLADGSIKGAVKIRSRWYVFARDLDALCNPNADATDHDPDM